MVPSAQGESSGAVARMLTTNLHRMIINPGYTRSSVGWLLSSIAPSRIRLIWSPTRSQAT